MDLGTGKITKKETQDIPHHLLSVTSPRGRFSASRYRILALKSIQGVQKRNKVPILCGGTGFYIQAVVDGPVFPRVKPNWRQREKLAQETPEQLWQILKRLDPIRARKIDRKNPHRLIRAIEICRISGKRVPEIKNRPWPGRVLRLGLRPDYKKLNRRIKKRLLERLKKGLVAEVKGLKSFGLSWRKLESFGLEYQWVSLYLQKKIAYGEMVRGLEKDIEKYAKRQMTWFKRDKRIIWLPQKKTALAAAQKVKRFLGFD